MTEQKLIEDGSTGLKLIQAGDVRILIVTKVLRYADEEMLSVKIVPLVSHLLEGAGDKLTINKFVATINHSSKNVSLGPEQGILLEENIQNLGVGSYALCEFVNHLKERATAYDILPYAMHMSVLGNKEYLEYFLGNFNIPVSYNIDKEQVMITMPRPADVISYYNKSKIKELDLEHYMYKLINNQPKTVKKADTINENNQAQEPQLPEDSVFGLSTKYFAALTIGVLVIFVLIIMYLIF